MLTRAIAALAAAVIFGSTVAGAQQTGKTSAPSRFSRADFDTTCTACTDFYTFANGSWLKRTPIPPSAPQWSSFSELQEKNDTVVARIVEQAARDVKGGAANRGTDHYRVGAFYAACVDTAAIERAGTRLLDSTLARIAAIKSTARLVDFFADTYQRLPIAPLWIGTDIDLKDATKYQVAVQWGSGGMPDRSYYLSQDAPAKRIRDAYVTHLVAILKLAGESDADAAAHAQTALAVETKLAELRPDRTVLRDANATYHVMTPAQLDSLTPAIRWERLLEARGGHVTSLNASWPSYFKGLNELLTSIPLEDWKTTLRARAANDLAPMLPARFAAEDFKLKRLFSGQQTPPTRTQDCLRQTISVLPDAVSQEYIAKAFSPTEKARATTLVENVASVLRQRIMNLEWMSDTTKRQALLKFDAMRREVGYPKDWRDYRTLELRADDYAGNVLRRRKWTSVEDWAELGHRVTMKGWDGQQTTIVNAMANPLRNIVLIPAGVLHPPFYDPTGDDAVNYGSIGMAVGHEMSHLFDDAGRRFDAHGNLRDWWTPADAAKYNVQVQRLVDQYNAYTVIDSATHVNGRLVVGEVIGHLGGLTVAYEAMEKAKAEGRIAPMIDGFSAEQRFFLSFAQTFRRVERDEFVRNLVLTNPHPPNKWFVDGVLANMPEFKAAWSCKDGDPMVRPDSLRARIW